MHDHGERSAAGMLLVGGGRVCWWEAGHDGAMRCAPLGLARLMIPVMNHDTCWSGGPGGYPPSTAAPPLLLCLTPRATNLEAQAMTPLMTRHLC